MHWLSHVAICQHSRTSETTVFNQPILKANIHLIHDMPGSHVSHCNLLFMSRCGSCKALRKSLVSSPSEAPLLIRYSEAFCWATMLRHANTFGQGPRILQFQFPKIQVQMALDHIHAKWWLENWGHHFCHLLRCSWHWLSNVVSVLGVVILPTRTMHH